MIGFDYGRGWSSTGWETSFYGGYERTLYDHPEVKIPYAMDVYLDPRSKMSYYTGQKLLKLFLYKVKQFKLTDYLLHKSTLIEKDSWGGMAGLIAKKKKYLVISEAGKKLALTRIIEHDNELKNLFEHYTQDILNSELQMQIKGEDDAPEQEFSLELEKTSLMKPFSKFDSLSGAECPEPVFEIQSKMRRPTYYSERETLLAKQLVDKLDITFDPDFDKIHSLKQGKLDVAKLAESVAGNDHIYMRTEEDQKTKPFSVAILCDESGSMRHDSRINRQYEIVKILYKALSEIMPQDRISVYGHSGDDVPEIYVYQDKYNPTFEDTIDHMINRDLRENYDGPVVEKIHQRIREQNTDNMLMIVISDGAPSGEHNYGGKEAIDELKQVIERCKRDNFVIMGIGFGFDQVREIYGYHTIVDDMSKVVEKTTTLLNKVVKTEFQ